MANVVVVGGGFAGLSAAVRIAKLRHRVQLLESGDELGGQLRGIVNAGRTWQVHPEAVTLPGVFRDLFRKSGRPMDQTLGLSKLAGRRHHFADKTVLDLPLGNRGDQSAALVDTLGVDRWSPWVDTYADTWDALRRVGLDRIFAGRDDFNKDQWKVLRPQRSLARVARRDMPDVRLRRLILDPLLLAGDETRLTPGFVAVKHYVERNFGLWTFAGGRLGLAEALVARAVQRKVQVTYGAHATGVVIEGGVVCGVSIGDEIIEADHVVWAAPSWPAPLPEPRESRRMPAHRTFVLLDEDAPPMSEDIMIHADPPLHAWTNGSGQWTIEHHGSEDPIIAMVRCGLDLRKHIVDRWDQSPADLATLRHWGWSWQRWSTATQIPGVADMAGLHFAGAHAHPGGSLEMIGMATAAIAETLRGAH